MIRRDIEEIKKLLGLILKSQSGGGGEFITLDQLNEILQEANYEKGDNKVQSIDEDGSEDEYPSTAAIAALAETWTFTLEDNTQVQKRVLCLPLQM